MLVADQGIVLHYITYSESSLIIKVLTKEKGVISLLKKGARRTASKGAKSKFPALSLVSVEYYFSEKRDLYTTKSIELRKPFKSLHNQIYKSAALIFMNELLYKAIPQEEKNDELFRFVESFLLEMDRVDYDPNTHLLFMLQLTFFLGISPDVDSYKPGSALDLLEGTFKSEGWTKGYASPSASEAIVTIMGTNFDGLSALTINRTLRKEILETLIRYYVYQLEGINTINSHTVLHELLE